MAKKRYGDFGGMYVPELLVEPLKDLASAWDSYAKDAVFLSQISYEARTFTGRPTPMTEAHGLAKYCQGPRLFLKREDLLHTGAHKINNAIGQCLLAKQMGKTRIIAETGAGQHGVATATACARLGLECIIYMGHVDAKRQQPNVERMRLLGATVTEVFQGSQTLKDAVNEALRDWATSYETTHYCLGSALGPYPYPDMVATLQSVIGTEAKEQILAQAGKLPDYVIACVGGGSNSIGIFSSFIEEEKIKLIGVEAGGESLEPGKHAARFATGKVGVLHGCYSYLLQDEEGQILPTHSISAGLDYPSIGPQHAQLYQTKRVLYTTASDTEAVDAMKLLSRKEGIIPALESSHALAYYIKEAKNFPKESIVLINLSGRGDKDLPALFAAGVLQDL